MRYFLHLSYNGTNFFGWQIQPNQSSVQENIQIALKHILKQEIEIIGCGRTDTGVHAKNYYAHFDFSSMSNAEIEDLKFKLNRYFSSDIRILNVFRVKDNAHARFDALNRTYKYYIAVEKQPFNNEFSYFFSRKLDIEKMNKACEKMFYYTDFTSFSKLHTQVNNNNCEIYYSKWEREGEYIVFTIKANRFLRNMVRAITGTMIEVGLGRMSVEDFCRVIEAKDRSLAGVSVPSKALFLYDIGYSKEIFL